MTRAVVPVRRPNVTRMVMWEGHEFSITIGLDPSSFQPVEVFADTAKGGDMQCTIADACVVISIALQHGVPAAALAKSLGAVPVPGAPKGTTAPASPVGAVVFAIIAEVRE